jgi:HEAT repeat protein
MSVTYYCPSCLREIGTAKVCPSCGVHVNDLPDRSYEEKLISSLRHPVPTVPIRVATILGELRSRAAVEPLINVALSRTDPYIQEAAVIALGRIGDPRARPCLIRLAEEGAVRVRLAAHKALHTLGR